MMNLRLHTTVDLRAWYAAVRADGRPIAWCSACADAQAAGHQTPKRCSYARADGIICHWNRA